MKWPGAMIEARFVKRYKRFFADCELDDGTLITAHCANTGSMRTCLLPGAPVWLTHNNHPKRKLKYTLYAIQMQDGWVGVHTGLSNKLVREAIENRLIPELTPAGEVKSELKINPGTRLDLFFEDECQKKVYVEVKNTTLLLGEGLVSFPDAVTTRGRKHLLELIELVKAGNRAVMFFCIQRTSAVRMVPSWQDDPRYAATLKEAKDAGVEILAYKVDMNKNDINLKHRVPFTLG
ncbi:MAG: DNA/RNA nuclease SfsA [Acidobacteria bacterium]|nr:MAG: DNA/RNA nuclease SfsA [Acidobacteriota bacterium]